MSQGQSPSIENGMQNVLAHHRAGRWAEAEKIYRWILTIDPTQADCLHLLGMIEYQAGNLEAAAELIRKAIAANRQGISYYVNLGTVLQAQGRSDEAKLLYRHVLRIKPNLAEVHVNLGNVLLKAGELEESIACYERALALRLESPDAHCNLGKALRAQGKPDEALDHFQKALAIQPDHAQAGFDEALTQLLCGDFAAGWKHFDRRWQAPGHDTPMRDYRQPFWTGEKLATGNLLIWGEQGVGDEIMFAGLIPDVVRTGNYCILDCAPRLAPLFARSFPEVQVVSGCRSDEDIQKLDVASQLPCGSLPGLFRTASSAFATTTSPYLIADPAVRNRQRARYADGRRLVGLAWHTSNRGTGIQRSIDLPSLAPLFAMPGTRWISMQYGDLDALEKQTAATGSPILIDHSIDQLASIDLFAAQIAAMDLVITIDNSTAHLAGALGVPVWVLLPFAPDWRWLLDRTDSPWYPTMRLFRQPKPGDWQSVVECVQGAMAEAS